MIMKKLSYILIAVMLPFLGLAQLDSIQKLDEVVLSDYKLKRLTISHKITTLNDSILEQQPTNFTNLLSFNSNIYFKEHGFGMTSSPSFRGTSAAQTAVLWNGININSQTTGQTDFGTLNVSNYDEVVIKSGGGSVQNGSGAIGGSIHLNNHLDFQSSFENRVALSYASFDTKQFDYSLKTGTKNLAVNAGFNYTSSENDFEYIGKDQKNKNGAFNNQSFFTSIGYTLDKKNILKYFGNTFSGERNLSGTLVSVTKNKYDNVNYRNLVEWQHLGNKFTSSLKVASIYEKYKYFENSDNVDLFSFGEVQQYIAKHQFNYQLNKKTSFNSIIEYHNLKGEGSDIGNPERDAFSATLLFQQKIKRLTYNLSARQDVTSGFKSPLVFSADANYNVTNNYFLKLNASKNYRVPTFNDLYWNPGGNLDLIPETAYQGDFGQELRFKHVNVLLNAFYIKVQDMIRWTPDSTGDWAPQNINNVESLGLELESNFNINFNKHYFQLNTKYSYTSSRNIENNRQLTYVPQHKANGNFAYGYEGFNLFYQHLYTGPVNIIEDFLKSYNVANVGFGYIFNRNKKTNYSVNFKANNIFNAYYENVALRPMPNRNYNLQLIIKF